MKPKPKPSSKPKTEIESLDDLRKAEQKSVVLGVHDSKATGTTKGVPESSLPPCTFPPTPVKGGGFRLAEGRAFDKSGGLQDRLRLIREYMSTPYLRQHVLSRRAVEALLVSWGHDHKRADEVFKNLTTSPSTEEVIHPDIP